MYFVLLGTVTCGTVDCAFVRTDAWLDFSRDLVSLWPKTRGRSKCGDCLLVTTVRTPSFSENRCPRPRSMWQPRSLKNSLDNKSGAPPGTTYTRSTPLTPAIPTGSIARVLVSSVSSLPKRNVMAFGSWIRCVLRLHLRVCVCSNFSRVFCPIRKREHPVSICSLTCCGLTRSRQRMMSSPLHHL